MVLINIVITLVGMIVAYLIGLRARDGVDRFWALRWKLAATLYRVQFKRMVQVIHYEKLAEKKYYWGEVYSKVASRFGIQAGYLYLKVDKQKEMDSQS
jgi:hypothetical protein